LVVHGRHEIGRWQAGDKLAGVRRVIRIVLSRNIPSVTLSGGERNFIGAGAAAAAAAACVCIEPVCR